MNATPRLHPAASLLRLAKDPAAVQQLQTETAPHGPAAFLWRLCSLSGIRVPFSPVPLLQAVYLQSAGGKVVPGDAPPRPGWVFVLGRGGEVCGLGVVTSPIGTLVDGRAVPSAEFYGVDLECEGGRPERRRREEVLYYLAFG